MAATRRRTFISISVVIVLIIALHYLGALAIPERFIRSLVNPLSSAVYAGSIEGSSLSKRFSSTEELVQGFISLEQQFQENEVDRARLLLLEDENKALREQLNFFSTSTLSHLGAQVIGRGIDPLGRTIIVDKGTNDGVAIDDPVIVGTGVLIGLVHTVEEDSSIVRLIDDGQSRIAARVLNSDKSIGLVEGGFGLSVQMNFIPQNENIVVGDLIVTSGLTRDIPSGLLIGSVEAVEREAYQPFQRAIIAPATALDDVFVVSILIEL